MSNFETVHKRHIEDVRKFTPEAVSRLSWSRDQVVEAQTIGLRKVVAHAQEHSPYYASRIGGLEASTLELGDLAKIPPLTKELVMDHWDDVVTDREVRLEDVVSHLDDLHRGKKKNPYFRDEIYAAATGGTHLALADRAGFDPAAGGSSSAVELMRLWPWCLLLALIAYFVDLLFRRWPGRRTV